jgi:hypothetical protein
MADSTDKSSSKSTDKGKVDAGPSSVQTDPGATGDGPGTPKSEITDAPPARDGQPDHVDPRLDNRTGDQRPTVPAELKPQQVHGGYVGDDTDFEDPPSAGVEGGDPGHASVGPHGRGPQTGPSSID